MLWRPQSPGNVGSVARAMKNMGLNHLRIAEPRRYDDPAFFATEAAKMAWDAADLLEAREEHPTLASAVADAVLVAGTTSQPPAGHAALAPRDLAHRLLDAAAHGPVALLFEQENTGLTREVLARCQTLGTIPSSAAYPSLNLAQAALIFLYEIRLAALARAASPPEARKDAPGPEEAPPAQAELDGFYGRLTAALEGIGFFEGSGRAPMVRAVRTIFNRALLTKRDLGIVEGIVRRIQALRPRPPGRSGQ